jgi:hypothetical protein
MYATENSGTDGLAAKTPEENAISIAEADNMKIARRTNVLFGFISYSCTGCNKKLVVKVF